ncbi:hypothetical protein ACWF5H_12685 [Arthrobacter sp. NPDC055138]
MTYRRNYDPTNREEVASTLRKEIRAARLKVTLDKKLGRETSPQVKLLAGMTLPPLVRGNRRSDERFGITMMELRTAAAVSPGEAEPFVLPERANRLTQLQREAVLHMIRVLLDSSDTD